MNTPISVGDIQLIFASGGRLRIDGGNMFGVVPRVLWEPKSPPDSQHRIRLGTNCVLVKTSDSLGLIDTGYGGKSTAKVRERHTLEEGTPLARSLAAHSVRPDEVDWVVLTHLHFDHAGGATYLDLNNRLQPMFPRARHFVQRAEWEDACSNRPELAGAYHAADFMPLEQAGLVELVDGDAAIVPGVNVQLSGGHTRGHQIVNLSSTGESAVCPGDICPTTAHLATFWTMAYDQFPLEVRRVKPVILNDIANHRRLAIFSHDPDIVAAQIMRVSNDEWSVVPPASS